MPGVVSDFDYHPDEPDVRRFRVPRADVVRFDDEACVYDIRLGDVVLRHFAFRDEWFKINVTLDAAGRLVETAPGPGQPAFAFNCDVATPMTSDGDEMYAVDLYADVLVRADGAGHRVQDVAELEAAAAGGLVSPYELRHARRGLERLLGLIDGGGLVGFLGRVVPFGPSSAGSALPMIRTPLAEVPRVRARHRPTWEPAGAP